MIKWIILRAISNSQINGVSTDRFTFENPLNNTHTETIYINVSAPTYQDIKYDILESNYNWFVNLRKSLFQEKCIVTAW